MAGITFHMRSDQTVPQAIEQVAQHYDHQQRIHEGLANNVRTMITKAEYKAIAKFAEKQAEFWREMNID